MEPYQSPIENVFNAITHGIGLLLAIAMLIISILFAKTPLKVTTVSIFGATMIILYLASTLYHAIPVHKELFMKLDHSAIYLLIAGTYTPILLVTIQGALGWTFFGIVWGLAILGIIFKSIYGDKYILASTILYIAIGWLALGFAPQLFSKLTPSQIIFLVSGGLAYSLGTYFYLSQKKYMHIIWHLCVIAGSICSFFAILYL